MTSSANETKQYKREDFQLVGQTIIDEPEQSISAHCSYLKEILRRFFKNKWACIFTFLFALIVIMAIYVPITSPFAPFAPVAHSQFIFNLPPNVLNPNVSVTVRVSDEIYQYLTQLHIHNLIINSQKSGIYYFVTLHPYYLKELRNLHLIFGTDSYGSDVWTNLWASVAASLVIAFITSAIAMIIGVIYGAIAGVNAGKNIDTIMMRFVEVVLGAPIILWIMILAIAFSSSSNHTEIVSRQTNNIALCAAMVCVSWAQPAIATRTYVLRIKNSEYVWACRTFGGSTSRVIFRHMLPIIMGRILVIFVNLIPTIIFFEASLTFLNLKSPSDVSLGVMLNNAWKNLNQLNVMLPPIVVFSIFTISAQIIANALNDAIDPRIVGR